jgi:capsular polysaccharide biosynthesis protein
MLLQELSKWPNFVVIDGSESLHKIIYYFTNASLIIGPHGSMFKNMIYCKKNPVLMELCPSTRHKCFLWNAVKCKFLMFYIVLESDKEENILLNKSNILKILKIIEEIYYII